MQTLELRHRNYLSFSKIGITFVLLMMSLSLFAQDEKMNNPEHDTKPYYFGISIGLNGSQFKIEHSNYFTNNDTIKNVTPLWKPGFQLGIMGNLRLSGFVDVRAIPSFVLREQALQFNLGTDSTINTSLESVLFSLPVEFKFKSDRQTNFRFYVAAGGKIDYDFNANSRSKRPDEIIRVKPFDFGYNLGLGFEFYYPNFIFSPEIKISNGLGNVLSATTDEPTNKALNGLTSRMIYITFHIEG
jgi:hypothetical protein